MKELSCVLLSFVVISFTLLVLCSCTNTDSTETTKSSHAMPAYVPATYENTITGSDVFDNGWYYESLDIHSKVKVSNYEPAKGVTWNLMS